MVHIVYRGSPRCSCVAVLDDWYSRDRTVIDADALVICDCGKYWIFRLSPDGVGYLWEPDETMKVAH